MSPVFIWQTEPTWFSPFAQHERITARSSACLAMCGYQSDTHRPLSPCCANLRREAINVLPAVPMAVIGRPNDAGIGSPSISASFGLGSNRSIWLGPPSMNSQMTDFAFGA